MANLDKESIYPQDPIEKTANAVLNLLVKTQQQFRKANWDEAKKSAIEGLSYVDNRELLILLRDIYQSKGDLVKSDCCLNLIKIKESDIN